LALFRSSLLALASLSPLLHASLICSPQVPESFLRSHPPLIHSVISISTLFAPAPAEAFAARDSLALVSVSQLLSIVGRDYHHASVNSPRHQFCLRALMRDIRSPALILDQSFRVCIDMRR
jgi:hypothetical protein